MQIDLEAIINSNPGVTITVLQDGTSVAIMTEKVFEQEKEASYSSGETYGYDYGHQDGYDEGHDDGSAAA